MYISLYDKGAGGVTIIVVGSGTETPNEAVCTLVALIPVGKV